jgi:hypothetical protein
MGIHRHRPTPAQERIGRAALVVLGGAIGFAGAVAGYTGVRMVFGLAEAGVDGAARVGWPVLVLSGFLGLVGLSLIALAFVPSHDEGRGPPRGFATLSRVFDGFWDSVRKSLERL